MSAQISQDNPIDRASILAMSNDELDQFIEGIRERRLRAQAVYQEAQEAKAAKQADKDAESLVKYLEKFAKVAEKVDKNISDLEKAAKEIRGIRLALGI